MRSSRQHIEGFEIVHLDDPLSATNREDLLAVFEQALHHESLFQLRIVGLSDSQRDDWVRKYWIQDVMHDSRLKRFAVRDIVADKFVGLAMLQYPGTLEGAEKEKVESTQKTMLDEVTVAGRDFLTAFKAEIVSLSAEHGYDPEKHFHKRNTVVLPSYHRQGLGTWLTEYCNDISDEAGQPTYVLARPKAWKMLGTTGFNLLQEKVFEATQFGWHEDAVVRIYKRDPHAT